MEIVLSTPAQAYEAINYIWKFAKPNVVAGRKMIVRVVDYEEDKTSAQRRFYHGYILTQVAIQARVDGQKFSMETWKEHFRESYLGSKKRRKVNPMTGEESWFLERVSTESLGVRKYNKLIEMVTAFATQELGVVFGETLESWSEYNTV